MPINDIETVLSSLFLLLIAVLIFLFFIWKTLVSIQDKDYIISQLHFLFGFLLLGCFFYGYFSHHFLFQYSHFIYMVLSILLMNIGIFLKMPILSFSGIFLSFIWWSLYFSSWFLQVQVYSFRYFFSFLGLMLIFYRILSVTLRNSKKISYLFDYFSMIGLLILTLLFSTNHGLTLLNDTSLLGTPRMPFFKLFMLILIFFSVFLLFLLLYKKKVKIFFFHSLFLIFLFSYVGFSSSLTLFSFLNLSFMQFMPLALFLLILFNLAFLFEAISMVVYGIYHKKFLWVNVGLLSFFIFLLLKYFDLIFHQLQKGVGFLLLGILFLGLGWFFEFGRRFILKKWISLSYEQHD